MLRMLVVVVVAAAAVVLASCATPFADQGLLADVSRVKFQGNGYTTRESVQVYWLYRCSELALEKGFAGFEILSDMHFVTRRPPLDDTARSPLSSIVASLRTRIPVSPDEVADTAAWVDQADLTSRSAEPIRMAHGGTFIYYGGGVSVPMASIEGDVHFLAGPVQSAPPKVFDAQALRDQLEPIIKGEKCGVGNVCPPVREYLLPNGQLR